MQLADPEHLLQQLCRQLQDYLHANHISQPLMLGIYSGGYALARRLHAMLGFKTPLGVVDISFQRDDFSRHGLHTVDRGSSLPIDINERDVILVDDILFTGRTARAAINELFDYGRARRIILL